MQPEKGGAPAAATRLRHLRAATYNVHQWVGADGRFDYERGLRTLRSLRADILGLQEVTLPGNESPAQMERELSRATGMHAVFGPTLYREDSTFGNVILHSLPLSEVLLHDFSEPGREPRGVVDVRLDLEGMPLRVLNTHFGLRIGERRRQVRRLLELLDRTPRGPLVLMGDFNAWFPLRRTTRILDAWFHAPHTRGLRTYPSRLPLFRLDRIWVWPPDFLTRLDTPTSPLTRSASDHLPLVAAIAVPLPVPSGAATWLRT